MTCTVSGTVVDPSGTPISGVGVDFNIQTPTVNTDPVQGTTTTATNGTWSLSLQQSISGVFTIRTVTGSLGKQNYYRFNVNIPASLSATFSSILVDS